MMATTCQCQEDRISPAQPGARKAASDKTTASPSARGGEYEATEGGQDLDAQGRH